jgi:parallel beta-helix repeat protein
MRIRRAAAKHGGIANSLTIIGIFGLLLLTIPPVISISEDVDTNQISFTEKIATAGHKPHSVILIDGDADFASQPWPGAGTDEDPYRIENLDIEGGSDDCIVIWNTRAHFIILNCTVRDNKGAGGIGIHLLNVSNAQLVNNLCENNTYGMRMQDCGSAAIINNTLTSCNRGISIEHTPGVPIHNNTFIGNAIGLYLGHSSDVNVSSNRFMQDDIGIYMLNDGAHTIYNNTFTENGDTGISIGHYCNDNTIANSTFIDNGKYAILLHESGGNTVANNTMIGCGLFLEPRYEIFVRQEQVTDNTVNGLPLVYLQDQVGGIVPADAGQIIVVMCSSIVVEDQTMANCSVGIQLVFSNYSIVTNNTITNCTHGINLERCGPYNLVTNNTCTDNLWTGIYISANGGFTDESTFNTVANNTCMRNDRGIYDLVGENNTIANNNCSWNYDEGIRIHASDGSVLANKTCQYIGRAAITVWASDYNSV